MSLATDAGISILSASVSGKTDSVTVQTNLAATSTEQLTITIDESLEAASGANGLWSGNLSIVNLSGVQVGPLLFGSGQDEHRRSCVLFGQEWRP